MAAHRANIKVILIPKENKKDIKEIPKKVREALTIIPVEHMDEVLRHALVLQDPDAFFRHAEEVAKREETDRKAPPAPAPAAPSPAPESSHPPAL